MSSPAERQNRIEKADHAEVRPYIGLFDMFIAFYLITEPLGPSIQCFHCQRNVLIFYETIQSSLLIMDLLYNGPFIIMDLFVSPDFR